ncbi:MAG: hypothetical protein IKX56_02650 [Muribaculaceae bacterium]|nr:hypothetical protein [Muribaculaceae bacterium]
MFSIIEHIEYLMTRHDCVVVPGWGAFIANYSPSRYDAESEVLEHPRRAVGFNADVTHNDGLLVQSLMRREGMSFDEATRYIADSVASYRQQLAADTEVSMGRLGFFRRNDGHYIEFVPFYRDNNIDGYFGLADVDIKSVAALERALAQRDVDGAHRSSVANGGRNLFTRRAMRIAASVVVLIGLGITLTTPIIADRHGQERASMAPTVTSPQIQRLNVTVQEGATAQAIEPVIAASPFASVGTTSGKYYMVISTLRNQQELDAFKAKYPELVPDMKILNYRGMMCVYVARSDDYGTLMSLRDKLPEALRDVWIYS